MEVFEKPTVINTIPHGERIKTFQLQEQDSDAYFLFYL